MISEYTPARLLIFCQSMSKSVTRENQLAKQPADGIMVRTMAVRHLSAFVVAEHAHQWHQLIYASEGVMWVHTAEGEWVVPPNRAVWVPAGIRHSIEMSGTVLVQTLYVHPSVKVVLPKQCSAVNISPLMKELILYTITLGALDRHKPLMARLMAFLFDQLQALPTIALQLPLPVDDRARQVVAWLRKHPEDNGSIKKLAKRVSTSVRTLERVFQKENGMTIGKWRMQLRLLQALRLLANRRSITEVALDVGYDSTSAFIAAFKRIFGTTPGRYFAND